MTGPALAYVAELKAAIRARDLPLRWREESWTGDHPHDVYGRRVTVEVVPEPYHERQAWRSVVPTEHVRRDYDGSMGRAWAQTLKHAVRALGREDEVRRQVVATRAGRTYDQQARFDAEVARVIGSPA